MTPLIWTRDDIGWMLRHPLATGFISPTHRGVYVCQLFGDSLGIRRCFICPDAAMLWASKKVRERVCPDMSGTCPGQTR